MRHLVLSKACPEAGFFYTVTLITAVDIQHHVSTAQIRSANSFITLAFPRTKILYALFVLAPVYPV
jgi:hypothetical protein